MDVVITYVDGTDPVWQEDYRRHAGGPLLAKRYRDWGTLKFLLRGIARHLPFVGKVFLVVSSESQVPAWADTSQLGIVLHRDIIPGEFLPTFNSTMIEMFLHRIPGLGERYLYFNDDMFPVMDCSEEDFFPEGRPAIGFSRHLISDNCFRRQVRRSDELARKALGMGKGFFYIRPQHVCSPMLRSECEKAFEAAAPEIMRSLTPLRSDKNPNQYFFLDYMFHSGKALDRRLSRKHFSLAAASTGRIASFLLSPDRKLVCINDVQMGEAAFKKRRDMIQGAFEARYPEKSCFEK